MPTTWGLAGGDVVAVMRQAMRVYREDLCRQGVKVGVLMGVNEDDSPIRVNKWPAVAAIRVVPLVDRLTKGYDAEIRVDRGQWEDECREPHRLAIMHHQLMYLELVRKDGMVRRDDLGRPRLKLRQPDWQGSAGWADVVKEHGEYAAEALSATSVRLHVEAAKRGQTLFDGIDPTV